MQFTFLLLCNIHAAKKVTDVLFVLIVLLKVTELVLQVPDKRKQPP